MTTYQTIDGVPRADLQAVYDELTDWKSPVAQKLRALLDAPANNSEIDSLRAEVERWKGIAGRRTAERTEFLNERDDLKAARHQGEPVAYRWRVKGHGEWNASVCKVEFDARANDDRFVAQPLYAEQPAPVAVTDEQVLQAMRPSIYAADGGYIWDTAPQDVLAAGRAVLALMNPPEPKP
jgi:hypothetical protein